MINKYGCTESFDYHYVKRKNAYNRNVLQNNAVKFNHKQHPHFRYNCKIYKGNSTPFCCNSPAAALSMQVMRI